MAALGAVHGKPPGLIVSEAGARPRSRPLESDIGDYSFDRAVICDRARTVDLLLANNFHFENNCAVLSVDGYPQGPFETVRTMLKRNPRLQVFALHDATLAGCGLAHRWPTIRSGSRAGAGDRRRAAPAPRRRRSAGSICRAGMNRIRDAARASTPTNGHGWKYILELAAIRPEQVLKRLFRAINRKEDANADSSGSDSGGGSDGYVHNDGTSFGSDAGDSDGGADSFG